MKKVLAFVLTLAMVLGCFSTVFAASYSDVKASDDFAEAIGVLSDLGVVSGYTDGTYKPENVVTRAEMAALIVKALGLTPAASATTIFSDVPATHWASGYVAYANSLGIIAGYTDGTFKPSKTVSYDEALTMIVSALGYTPDSLEGNTWPAAYVMKAEMLGITDDVTVLGSVGANRGDVAIMLYNTLGEEIGKTNKDGDFVPNKDGKDNMFARLGAVADTTKYIVGGSDVNADTSSIDLSEYFGAVVKVFWDGTGSDKKVIAIDEVVTEFVTIDDFDEDDFTSNWTVDTLNASFENGKADGALTKSDVEAVADDVTLAVVKSGSKIKTVYTAQAWVADNTIRIKDVEDYLDELEEDQTIDGGTYKFVMDEEDDEVIDTNSFILVGATSLEEIAEDSVLTFYVAGGKVAKIEVATKKVEGSVDKISGNKYTIDGTAYSKVSGLTLNKGDEGTFFFNYAGKIFDFEATVEKAEWLFGVVLDTGVDTGRYSGSDVTYVKMYTADGVVEIEVDTDEVTKAALDAKKQTLIAYDLDDDGLLCDIDASADLTAGVISTDTEVSKKGVVSGAVIADDATIIVNTEDLAKEKKYSVAKKEDYLGKTIDKAEYFYNDDNELVAIFVKSTVDASEDDKVLAIVTKIYELNTDKYDYDYEIEALYGGEAKTFYTDETAAKYTTAAAIAGKYYTFDLNADGVVTDINEKTETDIVVADGSTKAVTVSGSILKIGTTAYTLEDEITIYVYDVDDEKWTAATKLASSYKVGAYEKIVLFDLDSTADGEYDVVFVIK